MNKNKILKCKTRQRLDIVLQTYYPTIQEVEARGSWIASQLRLHTKTLLKKGNKQTKTLHEEVTEHGKSIFQLEI